MERSSELRDQAHERWDQEAMTSLRVFIERGGEQSTGLCTATEGLCERNADIRVLYGMGM